MIDYEKYDVIKDADEEKSHLCNSLNAEVGTIRHIILYMKNKDIPVFLINSKDLERWADYMERSQNVITYFQHKKMKRDEKNGRIVRKRKRLSAYDTL